MHTKALFRAAKACRSVGCAVLRFNFRGVGASAGAYDEGRGEAQDFTSGLNFMASRHPGVPLWAAGMSFGAFIALTVGAGDPRVSLLIGIAAPVDKPALADALSTSDKTKFFIHGERDELFPIKTMHRFYGQVSEPKELVVIDSADHLFDGKTLEVGEAVEELLLGY
jgi:alpha/beta superfamily hydrolase